MGFRYFTELAYNGSGFHGWQIQPNANSVQETLENAFSLILRQNIQLTGCGRTDTGVHAKYFVAHFDCEEQISDADQLIYKLNSYLNFDIVIYSVTRVDAETHARFSAIEREYEYHLVTRKNPFFKDTSFFLPFTPDFEHMNEAALKLLEHTDFTSFSKLHTDVKTNNCKIIRAEWTRQNEYYWFFHIRADRFLRNMVRAVVGTLLEVGKHKITVDEFESVIREKDRGKAGTSVPGNALFLTDVVFPTNLFQRKAD
ncbi:tRNA pseudouridine(38-40) synthase TruA [Saccharicrinis sp. FJH62]|uniref:tRNA pseudouridine(38-40) synthase TruA n=1 Tax=Saccharicrinis sp. FJH62 TaxID=3344657 RepID=UPI0035D41BF6